MRVFLLAAILCSCAVSFGAELTQDDLDAGTQPAIGDTALFDRFDRCSPESALAEESVQGKWWLRGYKAGARGGTMLCIEERDQKDPQGCIAPELTYPLALDGRFDIWVGTYRVPLNGGGIDIKLTRDKVYSVVNPREDGVKQWPPSEEKVGRLVECFYKTASLTGQNIHLRQPHGTYDSRWWGLCNAHIAYIRLVKRAPNALRDEKEATAALERRGVIVDHDGFSWIWQYGVPDIHCVLQQIEHYQYGNVDALNWCIGGSLATNFPHPMTSGRIRPRGGRLGDKRATRIYEDFEKRGIDVLQAVVDRCHELGIGVYASHRANVHYYSNDVWEEHPEWRLESRRGLDYANPEARAFYRDFLLYIPENYDIDGLTIDFSRHRQHFNPGQEDQFDHMNSYLRELRAGLDRIGAKWEKRLVLNASFTCGTWYDAQTPADQGLDVPTWIEEGIVDRIMPEGRDVMKYIEMCQGKKVQCYPRKTHALDFLGQSLQKNLHDPTAKQDAEDEPLHLDYAPLEILAGVLNWYDAGASGVFLFNYHPMTTLRHLPYPERIRNELAAKQPYGRRLGEKVEWLEP